MMKERLKLKVTEASPYLRVTFVQQHAVDALRVHPTRTLIRRLAVTPRDLRQVGREDLHLPDGSIHLHESKKR